MLQKRVVFSNQKGGVGKTTLTRELGIYLSSIGKNILLIDTDPQANLTKSLTEEEEPGLYEALTGSCFELTETLPGLSLLGGSIKLAGLEKSLIGEIDAYARMSDLLEHEAFKRFEYVLVDSPPSLGVLTVNALTAAQRLVIPMNPSLYSMQGTNDLITTVSKIRKNLNPFLELTGVIINAFDSIPVITRQIRSEIESSFGERMFTTALSKSIKIEEAIAGGHGIVTVKKAKVADEICLIGQELIRRVEESC